MEIEINNKKYDIDLERAKELGLVKEICTNITEITPGDVFKFPSKTNYSLLMVNCLNGKYFFSGCNPSHDGHKKPWAFSNYNCLSGVSDNFSHCSRGEMLNYINKHEMVYLGNVTEQFNKILEKFYES